MAKSVDLFLIRHGETTANRDDILQGQCDFPLTEKGIQGGKEVGKALALQDWDIVYASDLKRAHDTCSILLNERDSSPSHEPMQINLSPLLREISFGIREKLPRGTSVSAAKEIVAKSKGIPPQDIVDTAESSAQLSQRQMDFVGALFKDVEKITTKDVVKVLCVSHGAFIRNFVVSNCPGIECPKIDNCSITVIRLTKSGDCSYNYSIDPQSSLNRTDHLSERAPN